MEEHSVKKQAGFYKHLSSKDMIDTHYIIFEQSVLIGFEIYESVSYVTYTRRLWSSWKNKTRKGMQERYECQVFHHGTEINVSDRVSCILLPALFLLVVNRTM